MSKSMKKPGNSALHSSLSEIRGIDDLETKQPQLMRGENFKQRSRKSKFLTTQQRSGYPKARRCGGLSDPERSKQRKQLY
ncbi:hypothetical protein SAY86_016501 [Trapa natans]|uniref:Uncharacterized protein n=1 Tax=Trapa natans TaxID=22666 RepID=A0AAN7LDS1_TRANT|nr:hypothetical protein SAY86_016501 [Trapa natans]